MVKEHDTTKKHPAKPAAKRVVKSPAAKLKPAAAKATVAAKPAPAHKPKAAKKVEPTAHAVADRAPAATHSAPTTVAAHKPSGKYFFATGRRKTSVANVRVFSGAGEHTVNKKPFGVYFFHQSYREAALKAFELTGTAKDFHFTASIFGGGINSQSVALQHGLARALVQVNPEVHTVLKRNGLLTRDDRKKERKKPGLKRARRSPQWAKR